MRRFVGVLYGLSNRLMLQIPSESMSLFLSVTCACKNRFIIWI